MQPRRIQLRQTLMLSSLLGLVLPLIAASAAASPVCSAQDEPTGKPAGFMVTCEVSCSQEPIGTGQARLTWTDVPGQSSGLARTDAPEADISLETTVYRGGFEQDDLYHRLALSYGGREVATVEESQAEKELPRHYQIQLMRVERARDLADFETPTSPGNSAVVEGLVPGMNYTWRVVIESGGNRFVSEPVTCRAPICPADPISEDER